MLKFKDFKIVALSFVLLTTFLMTNYLAAHDTRHHHSSKFSLHDFKGSYTFTGQTVGGVDGTSGNSASSIAHVTFDSKGNGTVEFYGESIYTGPNGTPLFTASLFAPTGISIQLILTDPKFGIGNLVVTDSRTGTTTTIDFVTTIRKGKVLRLDGHTTQEVSPTHLATYTLEKQSL